VEFIDLVDRWQTLGVELAEDDRAPLMAAGVAAHRRLWVAVRDLTRTDCRAPSLLRGWNRGHVLTHLARNAGSQRRMLTAAMRSENAEQYQGGNTGRAGQIEQAGRPAPVPGLRPWG